MRAIVLEEYGGPEVLGLREIEAPTLGPDEVLVAVVAAGVNRADIHQRQGNYPQPGRAPRYEIPGLEVSGHIAALGSGVAGWELDQPVMAIIPGGGYAEQVTVHERMVMPIPDAVSVADAAAIPEVFATAWDALVVQGGLTPGGTALIHAGASGVGTAAIQLAKSLGARVAVTASAGKLDACRALGADVTFERGSDWSRQLRGVTTVLDVVGGEYLRMNLRVLGEGGTVVQVATMDQTPATVPLGVVLGKRARLVGTVLRARPVEEKMLLTQRVIRQVLPKFTSGCLKVVIDSRFDLDAAPDAHRHMEANANVGKVLLTP
jgi:putative PIG3 family NAD(P)H quinone oxidoreductase